MSQVRFASLIGLLILLACDDPYLPGSGGSGGEPPAAGGGGASQGGGGAAQGGDPTQGGGGASEGGGGAAQGGGGGTGEARPTDLEVSLAGPEVHLSWTSPDPSTGNTTVRLLRALNAPVAGPEDAAALVIYEGSADSALEATSGLDPDLPATPHTYHYAVYGCSAGGACEASGDATTLTPTLTECLAGGGYTFFWRHASADVCTDNLSLGTAATTSSPDWWRSCDASCGTATARQLNATGVSESESIGQDLDALGVPFGAVLSSEFCRAQQTASLMDLGPTIEDSEELTYFVYDEASRCADSYALLSTAPAAGTNTALVSHAGFTCATLDELAWAEAAIFKPDGAGSAQLVARVPWSEWLSLP